LTRKAGKIGTIKTLYLACKTNPFRYLTAANQGTPPTSTLSFRESATCFFDFGLMIGKTLMGRKDLFVWCAALN
jgi:hypothetical protein